MKRVLKSNILQYIIIFLVVFIYNSYLDSTYDHIIDFTHCFSIAKGLKIYSDYNIVVGPVYPIIISFFLLVFGNNILVFNIINSLLVVGIYYLIKKDNKNTLSLFILILFHFVLTAKYNTFVLLLFYIIYYFEKKEFKYKDYIIGLILGLIIFTKISVGVSLVIPSLILYWNDKKRIFKRIISISVISLIIVFIMFIGGVLPGFINYTLLGLIDFSKGSSSLSHINPLLIILFITVIYLILNIKKDKMIFYMLFFLSISVPSFDLYHIVLGIIPTIIYIIDKDKLKKYTYSCCLIFVTVLYSLFLVYNHDKFNIDMDCTRKYCSLDKVFNKTFDTVHIINKAINKKYKDYTIYYLNNNAYFYKLDLKENINKYDYIWEGNMGYNGEDKYIREIKNNCKNNNCLFVIYKNDIKDRSSVNKTSVKLLKFITDNYSKTDDEFFNSIHFYTSKKE